MTRVFSSSLTLLAAAAVGATTLTYAAAVTPTSLLEVPAAAALALFFFGGDELTWREDDGGVVIARGDRPLMSLAPARGEVWFLSLFEKKFVPVEEPRAHKILTLYNFYLCRPPEVGDELALDYPLRDRTYHIATRVTAAPPLLFGEELGGETPSVKVEGEITGWDKGRRADVVAYIGADGELARKLLRLSFKFTDWPRVTLTLVAAERD